MIIIGTDNYGPDIFCRLEPIIVSQHCLGVTHFSPKMILFFEE